MARKKKSLESKLGSWTDQATLTETTTREKKRKTKRAPAQSENKPPKRENYLGSHSLIDRLADAAQQHNMQQNEVVSYLLTWALDQVDAGNVTLPTR